MSAFREFMLKEYPYYENAGSKNVEMWQHIWDAAIKHAYRKAEEGAQNNELQIDLLIEKGE